MENFLPALLIIGGVIYKIYTEYQKEQEKARRRMPQRPQPDAPMATEQRPQHTATEPTMSIPVPTAVPPKKMERSMDRPSEIRAKPEKKRLEVKRDKPVATKIMEVGEKKEAVSFDLREAVIQSAILDRPYK